MRALIAPLLLLASATAGAATIDVGNVAPGSGEVRMVFAAQETAALPYLEGAPPDMYALPGNHDWYDGLTSFMRLFCQGGWVGAWRTRQRRSYFAVKLPSKDVPRCPLVPKLTSCRGSLRSGWR